MPRRKQSYERAKISAEAEDRRASGFGWLCAAPKSFYGLFALGEPRQVN
jgi:hypothetical protein